ncbi:rpoC, partial [Symbiodinium sp. CCMP2456]
IDSIAKSQGPSLAMRMNLHLASVKVPTKAVANRIVSILKDLRERRNMMETATARHQLPEWMMFTSLPVLPPDLRLRSPNPENVEEFPDDMNIMYKDILSAGRLFQVALAERAPAGLLRYRKFMLQMAVDCLIDNGRINPAKTKTSGDPLESVAKRLKGKQGRMRKNMLGKRVDYSARTVIVVEPKLKLDECGLPFEIAKEMYMPFLMRELKEKCGQTVSLWATSQGGERERLLEWFDDQSEETQYELLRQAMGDRKIILNRAPTLHRLSMQAFKPTLIPGKALKIHPLVCSPFNADFDGDTMTIHLVLSKEAQKEAEDLMLPSRNLNSPASGDPVIGPTQDMVLGLYYMSSVTGPLDGPLKVIDSVQELEELTAECSAGEVSHLQEVHVPRAILQQIAPEDENVADGPDREDPVRTTAGRLQFFMMLHTGKVYPMRSNPELLDRLDAAPLVEP